MDNDTKKFLSDLLAELQRIDYVRPEDIPNIDLYMDQITTFMDSQLETSKRHLKSDHGQVFRKRRQLQPGGHLP